MMKRRRILKAGLGLTLGSRLLAAVKQNKFDAAADVLRAATESGQVESSALFIRRKSEVVAKSFGKATSIDASFLLASISKPIAVAAAMTLFDAGEFKLNDFVRKFLPEFVGQGREEITMQQLFTHNSGLPDQLPENARLRAAHAPLSQFVSATIRTPLLFAPGSKYSYSSMAILLASEVARRITGKSIATLIDETVCRPLELKHTALGVGHLNKDALIRCQIENAAPESGSGNEGTRSWDWNSGYWRKLGVPWGGVHGSVGDVAKFLDAFLHPNGKLLQPATARLMVRNHNPANMRPRGLGFDLGSRLNGPARDNVFGHTGSTGTLCWADAESDTVCVILTTLPGRATNPHPRNVASRHVAASIQ